MTFPPSILAVIFLVDGGAGADQPTLVEIPAGCSRLGFIEGWKWAREVCLPALAIDRTEVTVDAYRRCVDAGVCGPACGMFSRCE